MSNCNACGREIKTPPELIFPESGYWRTGNLLTTDTGQIIIMKYVQTYYVGENLKEKPDDDNQLYPNDVITFHSIENAKDYILGKFFS